MNKLDEGLYYLARGWSVIPMIPGTKKPFIKWKPYQSRRANEPELREWLRRRPDALLGIVTGAISNLVVLDVDFRKNEITGLDKWGTDSLEELFGITLSFVTACAHTPSNSLQFLFQHPGHYVTSTRGEIGLHLDVRADGGYFVAPTAPGRFWDPHLTVDTPLLAMPAWVENRKTKRTTATPTPRPDVFGGLTPYAVAALDGAADRIQSAPNGLQEETLNRESFSMGRLAGGNAIPPAAALEGLLWIAHRMRSYDSRRPWSNGEVDAKVMRAFTAGLRQPRTVADAR